MQVLKPMCQKDRAVNRTVTQEFLNKRVGSGKYGKSMWIRYCEFMLARGYKVELYEAKETFSKYITVYGANDLTYKVRFSDHPPSKQRMVDSDVNMVVRSSQYPGPSLEDAIKTTLSWFEIL